MSLLSEDSYRLAEIDAQVVALLQEAGVLLKPSENNCFYYVSNMRTPGDSKDMVVAAVGDPVIIAGLMQIHARSNPQVVDALPVAAMALENALSKTKYK